MKAAFSLTFDQAFPKGAFIAEVRPWFEYQNNQRTDKQLGLSYIFVNRQGYDKIGVHVSSFEPVITNAEIEAASDDIQVVAEGFKGRVYATKNGLSISGEAEEVRVLNA